MQMRPPVGAFVAVPFALGVAGAACLSTAVWALVTGAAACAAVFWLRDPRRATALLMLGMVCLGSLLYSRQIGVSPHDVSRSVGTAAAVEGTVAGEPEARKDRIRFTVRAERVLVSGRWRSVSGRLLASLPAGDRPAPGIDYGDRIRLNASLYAPSEPTNPGATSWKNYLARQGVHCCCYVRSARQIELLPHSGGNPVVAAGIAARRYIASSIDRMVGGTEAGVVAGMVLGTYAYLPQDVFLNFQRTGTLHLLAASGFNCFVLMVAVNLLLTAIPISKVWRNTAAIACILFYVVVAGGKPSLVRAAIMASLLLIAPLLRRVPATANLFFVAMLVILLVSPADLFDVGFQLSFAAVGALIWVFPLVEKAASRCGFRAIAISRRDRPVRRVARKAALQVGEAIVGTIAVSLVTAPLIAYHFGYVSLVSVPANAVLVIGLPAVFVAGLAAPVLSYAPAAGAATSTVVRCMLDVVNGLGGLRHAAISLTPPPIGAMSGYYVLLWCGLGFARAKVDER